MFPQYHVQGIILKNQLLVYALTAYVYTICLPVYAYILLIPFPEVHCYM